MLRPSRELWDHCRGAVGISAAPARPPPARPPHGAPVQVWPLLCTRGLLLRAPGRAGAVRRRGRGRTGRGRGVARCGPGDAADLARRRPRRAAAAARRLRDQPRRGRAPWHGPAGRTQRAHGHAPAHAAGARACKFGFSCTRRDCFFGHPEGRAIDAAGAVQQPHLLHAGAAPLAPLAPAAATPGGSFNLPDSPFGVKEEAELEQMLEEQERQADKARERRAGGEARTAAADRRARPAPLPGHLVPCPPGLRLLPGLRARYAEAVGESVGRWGGELTCLPRPPQPALRPCACSWGSAAARWRTRTCRRLGTRTDEGAGAGVRAGTRLCTHKKSAPRHHTPPSGEARLRPGVRELAGPGRLTEAVVPQEGCSSLPAAPRPLPTRCGASVPPSSRPSTAPLCSAVGAAGRAPQPRRGACGESGG